MDPDNTAPPSTPDHLCNSGDTGRGVSLRTSEGDRPEVAQSKENGILPHRQLYKHPTLLFPWQENLVHCQEALCPSGTEKKKKRREKSNQWLRSLKAAWASCWSPTVVTPQQHLIQWHSGRLHSACGKLVINFV